MALIDDISVMLLTLDEAPNIERTLAKLDWAKRILVIDSGSADGTLDLLACHPQVCVIRRPFDDFAGQCNFGLSHIASEWVLSLDADYVLSDRLIAELEGLEPDPETAGFEARFVYCVFGRPLSGSLYPPRIVLYRKARAQYRAMGHGHRVSVDGHVARLAAPIYHDDRKPLSRWHASQIGYARREADHLLATRPADLRPVDRIRRMAWPAPFLVFFYTLVVKRCLFDGWPGWFYVLQRTLAETLLAMELIERRSGRRASEPARPPSERWRSADPRP